MNASGRFTSATCCEIGLGWCEPRLPGVPQLASDSVCEREEVELNPPQRRWVGEGLESGGGTPRPEIPVVWQGSAGRWG
jgi:hypothetical protein